VILALLLVLAAPAFAGPPRFFIMGSGRIVLVNGHTDERVSVRYRRDDNTYDETAMARIKHVFRSRDGGEGDMSLRLIEILSKLQDLAGGKDLVIISGYRSPEYNEGLRAKGVRAAGGSLHTEGLAADLAFPKSLLKPLWMKMREMDCCGAGYYQKEGFLHIDVGRARFWEPQTSRVEENLSAGNAKLFARTEYDRYEVGEEIVIRLHAMTVPPVGIASTAEMVGDTSRAVSVGVSSADAALCNGVTSSGSALNVKAAFPAERARLVLSTCEPRAERTPAQITANQITVR
jgi:uncharacterized protein YcbK (DUF882 family)